MCEDWIMRYQFETTNEIVFQNFETNLAISTHMQIIVITTFDP